MKRVPPSERTRKAIQELLHQGTSEAEPRSELVRLAVQRIVEEALEAEVRDRLGREYYEHGAEGRGHRNGYRTGRLKTSEGAVEYAVPQVCDVPGGFASRLRDQVAGRTEALEQLGIEMYARGLSTRDIEAAFRGEDGRSLLTRSAVSDLTEALWKEYEEFATRDLSELEPLYLFVDGVTEKLHAGAKREAVLAAWAILWSGKKVLLHVAPGTKESTECVVDFFQDMKRRGLRDPILVNTDGAPGLIAAVDRCFPTSLRQRCLAHRVRNIVSKLPEAACVEVKQAALAAYQAPSVAMAEKLRDDLVERYQAEYPSAVACFLDDFDACVAQLRCPPAHRRIIRTTNLLERLFEEERRRTRAAHTIIGERAVMKLMYASLVRASDSWRGVTITDFERRQLEALREQLISKHQEKNRPLAKSASKTEPTPLRIPSKQRT